MSMGAKQLGALVIAIVVAVASVGITASALSDDGIVKNAFDEQFTVLSEATVESGGGSGTGGGGNPGEETGGGGTGGGGGTSYEVVDGNKNNLHYHNDELFTGICGDYTYENGKIVSKITFDFNGGKGLMDSGSQECESKDPTNATQPTRSYMNTDPTRDGYTLLGWSTSATATTATYTSAADIPRTLGDNVTYYAVWEAQSQGETWVLNDTVDISTIPTTYIEFDSNGEHFYGIGYLRNFPGLDGPSPWGPEERPDPQRPQGLNFTVYDDQDPESCISVIATYVDGQVMEDYRTITFSTAPTGDLLTWLQANAVKQG